MSTVIPKDHLDSAELSRQCIDSINKSIMLDSVNMIAQSGHLKRLYETYNKVFDYIFYTTNSDDLQLPKTFPGGLDTDDWLA